MPQACRHSGPRAHRGSLARRLRESGCHVSAWNHRDHPYANARAAGIDCKDTLEELVAEEPDVLMLCNPLVAMPQVLQTIKPIINPQKTTLSDVGSVKGPVHTQVSEVGLLDCYVGAHPMAGNEHSGWVSADPTLFNDALWAVTFGPQTVPEGRANRRHDHTRGAQHDDRD